MISAKRRRLSPTVVLVAGTGDEGQLGLGEEEKEAPLFTELSFQNKSGVIIELVAAGAQHSAAITASGEVYTWGCNDGGACGIPEGKDNYYRPTVVRGLAGIQVVQLSCGDSHTAAVTSHGNVIIWGQYRNLEGDELAYPSSLWSHMGLTTNLSSPTLLHMLAPHRMVAVAAAANFDVCLSTRGEVFQWGAVLRSSKKKKQRIVEPESVSLPLIRSVFGGSRLAAAIDMTGRVWAWGNYELDLSSGSEPDTPQHSKRHLAIAALGLNCPQLVYESDEVAVKVAIGREHLMILTSAGRVLSMGRGMYGELGLGTSCLSTTVPRCLDESRFVDIACTHTHSLALCRKDVTWSWGVGGLHQLGQGKDSDVHVPCSVRLPQNCHPFGIAAGAFHSIIVAERGCV